ncbi:HGGxSTG domain-containing protein [Bradyrhizobium sp. CB1717]|uniref:HGGxSTG domain-containing protein n=1 Tax=Bradyrhizobium sp. CB1717 TaxID=3039154 RepID=UPI0024B192BD|nr:HGGxSTG domain-containing protein [Bradyrhizobium sp. CB1717]WFU22949.1 HGGxSTG domain-containing protein [Bradyrhizobium sp. CB1717]
MTGGHTRNTLPMRASPRCGARTRDGAACRSPAARGKARCRMHGGTPGCGAPLGNRNARKHGLFARETIDERRQIESLLDDALKLLRNLT